MGTENISALTYHMRTIDCYTLLAILAWNHDLYRQVGLANLDERSLECNSFVKQCKPALTISRMRHALCSLSCYSTYQKCSVTYRQV